MAESWEENKTGASKKRRLSSCQKHSVQNTFCLPVGRILLASHFDQWESTFLPFKCLSQCKIQTAERLYLHINQSSRRAGSHFWLLLQMEPFYCLSSVRATFNTNQASNGEGEAVCTYTHTHTHARAHTPTTQEHTLTRTQEHTRAHTH